MHTDCNPEPVMASEAADNAAEYGIQEYLSVDKLVGLIALA